MSHRTTLFALLAAALMAAPATAATPPAAHPATKTGVKKVVKTQKTTVQKAIYTCPMHPEVKADKPGDCPKCGMHLEKKA